MTTDEVNIFAGIGLLALGAGALLWAAATAGRRRKRRQHEQRPPGPR